MNRKAIIFGLKGYNLTKTEKKFIKKNKPWGIILFSRNIKNIIQLKKLVSDIKRSINDKNYPILIDQEGGNVSRLNKIIDFTIFSQDFFGNMYKKNKKISYKKYNIYINAVCDILNFVGININTVPVLDIRRKKSHRIIGTRSFSENPNIVAKLGNICVDSYSKNKIACVIKHIPGHGLSRFDTHYRRSIVSLEKSKLIKKDFKPFKLSKANFAMTAHIIYSKYDDKNTATHSKIVIKDVIRKEINFNGILISDDISMKSLKYKIQINALRAINAGCNLVLHCNGKMKEMIKLANVIPKIDNFTQKKTSDFYKFLR